MDGLTDLAHKVSSDMLHRVDTLQPYFAINCCAQFFPKPAKPGWQAWIILSECFSKQSRSNGKPQCDISMVKLISVVASCSVKCDLRALDSCLLQPIPCSRV